ncbi:hypothetical protein Tco_0493362 [Tanacetum coccineum]
MSSIQSRITEIRISAYLPCWSKLVTHSLIYSRYTPHLETSKFIEEEVSGSHDLVMVKHGSRDIIEDHRVSSFLTTGLEVHPRVEDATFITPYRALLYATPRDDALACFVTWRPRLVLWRRYNALLEPGPIAIVIGDPSRSVSTRKQLKTNAMWCYFDALLTSIKPKNFKQAMTEPSWIDAMQEEIHEFKRLQV